VLVVETLMSGTCDVVFDRKLDARSAQERRPPESLVIDFELDVLQFVVAVVGPLDTVSVTTEPGTIRDPATGA
jgi:hypothetical protein